MTNRAPLLIAFTLAIFAVPACGPTAEKPAAKEEKPPAMEEKPAATAEKPAATEEKAAATAEKPAATAEKAAATEETSTVRPAIEAITITAKEPAAEKPLETTRPRFRWAAESAARDLTYDVILWEVDGKAAGQDEAGEGKEPQVVFERRSLREAELAYPESGAPLDKTKFYAWAVVANDSKGNQVGRTITSVGFLPFPPFFCWGLFVWPPTLFYCQQPSGNSNAAVNWSVVTFPSGPPTATWTVTGPNNIQNSGTVNCTGAVCSGVAPVSWPASQPGAYQGTLTVTRGNCTRSRPITLFIYPSLQVQVLDYYPGGSQIQKLCWGDDATLTMLDVNGNPPPAGCQVKWEYSDNGSTWKPLGQGNPFNTNPITSANPLFSGLSCTGASIALQFRGTLDPNCLNLPSTGWPPSCPNVKTTPLTVDCPTVPGVINVAQGIKICSDKNNDGTPDYPITLFLTLAGSTGSIVNWYVDPPGSPPPSVIGCSGVNCSYTINQPGVWSFSVDLKNGACPGATASVTVTVEDPIQGTVNVTPPNPEVCWGGDKVAMTFVPTNPLPPGAILTWEYQIDCAGPWTASGVTGTTQNSNDLILTPFYPSVNSCLVDKVCWRITAKTQAGICPPSIITPVTIKVVKPFDKNSPPVISPAQPPVKCPGQPTTLTVSNYNNCATAPFTFQWYLDGELINGATAQSFNAVEPGSYTVEVCNKNKCDCIETAPVIVRDCLTLVEIKGPCTCKDGDLVTLTATVSSQVIPGPPSNCGSPYTYLWSTGETTASIQVKCPTASQAYSVEVKDGTGCKTKASYTIKRCP